VVILHAFLALAAGLAVIVALSIAINALVKLAVPSWTAEEAAPHPAFAFVTLGSSLLASAAGGYITSLAATSNPLIHVLALGITVLALAAVSALQSRGKQPVWFQLAQVAVSPLGVLAGGLVRLRVLGIL
jgi:uncharacterized membrane protein